MSKKLNTDQIQSELAESAFFPGRRPLLPQPEREHVPHQPREMAATGDVMTSKRQNVKSSQRHESKTSKRHDVTPTAGRSTLDLGQTAYRDFTLRLTDAEYEALDDLERELRRRYGVATSKNNLIRCGIHYLVENQAQAKEHSIVLQKLPKQKVTS